MAPSQTDPTDEQIFAFICEQDLTRGEIFPHMVQRNKCLMLFRRSVHVGSPSNLTGTDREKLQRYLTTPEGQKRVDACRGIIAALNDARSTLPAWKLGEDREKMILTAWATPSLASRLLRWIAQAGTEGKELLHRPFPGAALVAVSAAVVVVAGVLTTWLLNSKNSTPVMSAMRQESYYEEKFVADARFAFEDSMQKLRGQWEQVALGLPDQKGWEQIREKVETTLREYELLWHVHLEMVTSSINSRPATDQQEGQVMTLVNQQQMLEEAAAHGLIWIAHLPDMQTEDSLFRLYAPGPPTAGAVGAVPPSPLSSTVTEWIRDRLKNDRLEAMGADLSDWPETVEVLRKQVDRLKKQGP